MKIKKLEFLRRRQKLGRGLPEGHIRKEPETHQTPSRLQDIESPSLEQKLHNTMAQSLWINPTRISCLTLSGSSLTLGNCTSLRVGSGIFGRIRTVALA